MRYTITLSENEPYQIGSAWQEGSQATIWQENDGTWSSCVHGVGSTGLYGESDDMTGYASAREAEDAAREFYEETIKITPTEFNVEVA